LPTPTTQIPLPTLVPTPLPSVAEQEEEPASTEPPVLEAPAPETTVTTTIVQPKKPDEPR
jgi:hypothetical protein